MASTLENVLTLLEKWPRWKRINELPDKTDELIQRVEALERRLEKRPGEDCPYCGEPAMRLERQAMHGQMEDWLCTACGKKKVIRHDLAARNGARR